MFDPRDMRWVDPEYFQVIRRTEWDIEIKSRCTGHYWMLHCTDAPIPGGCEVFHRHHKNFPYHHQWSVCSIHQAVKYIKEHDVYQLNGRQATES